MVAEVINTAHEKFGVHPKLIASFDHVWTQLAVPDATQYWKPTQMAGKVEVQGCLVQGYSVREGLKRANLAKGNKSEPLWNRPDCFLVSQLATGTTVLRQMHLLSWGLQLEACNWGPAVSRHHSWVVS